MLAGNAVRPDAIVMDAPWTLHWPKLILWVIVEGLLIACGTLTGMNLRHVSDQAVRLPCLGTHALCCDTADGQTARP